VSVRLHCRACDDIIAETGLVHLGEGTTPQAEGSSLSATTIHDAGVLETGRPGGLLQPERKRGFGGEEMEEVREDTARADTSGCGGRQGLSTNCNYSVASWTLGVSRSEIRSDRQHVFFLLEVSRLVLRISRLQSAFLRIQGKPVGPGRDPCCASALERLLQSSLRVVG
jgi:hypothetical protein